MRQRIAHSEMLRFCLALVLGTVLTLWTRDPVPGVILAAIQTGWNSVATGLWLWRFDLQRGRARSCLMFHLATASWQVSAAALVSLLCIAAAGEFMGAQPNMAKIAATLLVLAGGVVVSMLLGLIAIVDALWQGLRVWIRPRLRSELVEAADGQLLFPVNRQLPQPFNYAIFVTATSLVTPPIVLGILLLILFTVGVQEPPLAPTLAAFGVVFGGPLLMLVVYALLSSRLMARHPSECWPEGTLPTITRGQIAKPTAERHQIA